jgi:subtilisin-like proprotein convertase family protein/subtilisin family serine protease
MRFLRVVFALAFLPLSAFGVSPSQSVDVNDHGQRRKYSVAADESAANRRVKKSATGAAGNEEVVLYPTGEERTQANRRIATKRISAQLAPDADATAVASSIGGRLVGMPRGERWQVFEVSGGPGAALDALPILRKQPGVIKAEPLLARVQNKRGVSLNDPLFSNEWHLNSTNGANVINAWSPTSVGSGVTIAIIDDGIQHSHPDLVTGYDSADSYDFNERDPDPEPPSYFFDDHGTACAGVAAAWGNNGIGVAGVAYRANLAGLRLISAPVTDEDEADAFAFHNDTIQIKSNSWGPIDRLLVLEGPGPLAVAAIEDGVKFGRGGLGTIYLFAAGNGGEFGDNVNFDGYAARRETIAVGAVDEFGVRAPYSEEGACLVVTAPSSGATLGITTTDRVGDDGFNIDGRFDLPDLDYTEVFGGTSSACPLVAGVTALMLQRNPNLGWRDVQEILMKSATKNDAADSDWITNANGTGFHFNHKYGAGRVDAAAAVNLATTWINLGENIKTEVVLEGLATPIPDNKASGVEFVLHVEADHFRVEHALLTTSIKHPKRGQLEITLTSPDGTESRMATLRKRDRGANYEWTFSSVRHWGEMAKGDWTVHIADRVKGKAGTVDSLKLTLWGAAPAGALVAESVHQAGQATVIDSIPATGTTAVDFVIRNAGKTTLTNVVATLAQNQNLTGSVSGGTFSSIAPGETKVVQATLTPTGGLGVDAKPALNITANGYSDALRYSLVIGKIQSITLANTQPISLPSFSSFSGAGKAGPYPTTIDVFAVPAGSVVTDVKLHLHHLLHERSSDLDVLLVSPDGKRMIAMSDAGGFDVIDEEITLTDSAENPLPDTAPLFGGTFRPSNYGATLDKFPAPAPPKPYQSSFSIFRGSLAEGKWSLYIYDDASRRLGSIGSWELEIQYATP